jgi:hypothetical protein
MTVLPPFSGHRMLHETLDDMGLVKVGEEFLKIITVVNKHPSKA